MKRRAAQAGFTLIEILAVLAIMAAAAAVVAPLLRGPPLAAQLRADTMRIAAALRLTRAAAMAQNRAVDAAVDRSRGRLASMTGLSVVIDPRIAMQSDFGGDPAIRFFPSGRSTGGTIRLSTDTQAARISVVWATGDVRIEP